MYIIITSTTKNFTCSSPVKLLCKCRFNETQPKNRSSGHSSGPGNPCGCDDGVHKESKAS